MPRPACRLSLCLLAVAVFVLPINVFAQGDPAPRGGGGGQVFDYKAELKRQ